MQTGGADMSRALLCVLMAAWSLGSSGQRVHQPEGDIHTVEGATVMLHCSYETSLSINYIFWYKQEANAAPEFILSRFKIDQGKTADKYTDRYSCSMDASAWQAPLRIKYVKPSDSGVFYCALQPTLTHPLARLHKNSCNRLISEHTLEAWSHSKKWVKLCIAKGAHCSFLLLCS